MQLIKQNEATASKRTVILYCVDGTGLVPYTAGSAGTVNAVYPGASTAVAVGTLTPVTLGTGHYYVALPTSAIGTIGPSRLMFSYLAGTKLEAYADLMIVPFDPYDSTLGMLYLGTVGTVLTYTGTVGTLLTYLGTIGTVGTVLVYAGTVGTVATLLTYLGTMGTVGTVKVVGDKTGYSLAADQSAVTIGTLNTYLGTMGTVLAVGTLLANALAGLNAEVDTALADINLDHLLAVDPGTTISGTIGAILIDMIKDNGAGTWQYTTVALENAPGGGTGVVDWTATERSQIRYRFGIDGATAAATATNNLGTVTALVADKTGFSLLANQSAVTIGTLNTYLGTLGTLLTYLGTVGTVGTVLVYSGTVGTVGSLKVNLDKTGYGLAADQSAVTVGTVNIIPAIGSVGTVGTLGVQAQADVWAYATRAITDKAGFSLAANQATVTIGTLNTYLGTIGTVGTAKVIGDKTGYGLAADQSLITIGTLNTYLGTVGTVLRVGSLLTQAKADVNAEMVDVIGTDAIAELGVGAPSATPSLKNAVMILYMDWRNQVIQTSTLRQITDDVGTVIAQSTLSDTGTTFTKTEYVSG